MHVDAHQEHRHQQHGGACACQRAHDGDACRACRRHCPLDRCRDDEPLRRVQREVEDERVDLTDDVRVNHETLRQIVVHHHSEPVIAAADQQDEQVDDADRDEIDDRRAGRVAEVSQQDDGQDVARDADHEEHRVDVEEDGRLHSRVAEVVVIEVHVVVIRHVQHRGLHIYNRATIIRICSTSRAAHLQLHIYNRVTIIRICSTSRAGHLQPGDNH